MKVREDERPDGTVRMQAMQVGTGGTLIFILDREALEKLGAAILVSRVQNLTAIAKHLRVPVGNYPAQEDQLVQWILQAQDTLQTRVQPCKFVSVDMSPEAQLPERRAKEPPPAPHSLGTPGDGLSRSKTNLQAIFDNPCAPAVAKSMTRVMQGSIDDQAWRTPQEPLSKSTLRWTTREATLTREAHLVKQSGRPHNKYKVLKKLGEGSFGVAELVEHKYNGRKRCMKTVNKKKAQMPPELLEQEFQNMAKIDHPHVIKLFEYYEDFCNVYFIMECLEGGDLVKFIADRISHGQAIEEGLVAQILKQVLTGLACCHERALVHKDLKVDNIMLLDEPPRGSGQGYGVHAVIIDLGLAECFRSSDARGKEVAGTPSTMAPELWRAWLEGGHFGLKCDIYSLGCVLFQMLSVRGEPPIDVENVEDPRAWLHAIARGPDWSLIRNASLDAQDLVRKMLAFDERARPTAPECLQHRWFANASHNNVKLSDQQLSALVQQEHQTDFEKTVLMKVATQLSIPEMRNISDVFMKYDTDCSGYLAQHELVAMLRELGVPPTDAAEAACSRAGPDGRVNYTEFVSACIAKSGEQLRHQLWGAFTEYDKDGSGELSREEVAAVLMGGAMPQGAVPAGLDLEGIIRRLDTDGSGTISFKEFEQMFIPQGCQEQQRMK